MSLNSNVSRKLSTTVKVMKSPHRIKRRVATPTNRHSPREFVTNGRSKVDMPLASNDWGVTLRQLPGATVLGLLAAIVAHGVLFGGSHAWGGAYHTALLLLAFAAVVGLTAGALALLWSGERCAADGTILAARLRELMPGWSAVAVSAAGWFMLGECLEVAHSGVPLLILVVILSASAWMVRSFASFALRALAGIVFAIALALHARCQSERLEGRSAPSPLRGYARDSVWRARLLRAPPMIANA